jgi:hypothetical protein
MSSSHTLDDPLDQQEPTTPAERAAAADALYRQTNPDRAHLASHPDPLTRHELVRGVEDLEARGYRAWYDQALENPPTPPEVRQAALRERAAAAQLTTQQAERAFDRLNPEFGVPANTTNPYLHRDAQRREAALSLGVRVAIHDLRQNDRDPIIWQVGQDYRAADAIRRARTQPIRMWQPAERVGAER